jgi:hypothetical protein
LGKYFSLDGAFDYVGDQLVEMLESGESARTANRLRESICIAQPFNLKQYLRFKLKK